jgi:glycerol-3-phosphate acyltransferase PlsY
MRSRARSLLNVRHLYSHDLAIVTAFGAFLGHLYPVWLAFKGGKGVATYIGLLLALSWPVAIAFCLIWLAVAAITRYSPLAGLLATVMVPVALWMIDQRLEAQLFVLLTILLWFRHRDNIARLTNGTEGKIGRGSASTQGTAQ